MTVFLTEQVLFVHVPKTAGTTVRLFLESHFSEEAVFPSEQVMAQDPQLYNRIQQVHAYPPVAVRQALLVRSHIPYPDIAPLLDLMPLRLTMLRLPTRRAISEIFHHLRNTPALQGYTPERIISERPDVYPPSWSYFGRNVDEAIETALGFDWIGIQEHFESSMEMLCALMGWAKPASWDRQNVMPADQGDHLLTASMLERLSEALYDDMRFYMTVRNEAETRMKARSILKAA